MDSLIKKKIIKKFCHLDQLGNTLLTPFVISKEKKVIYYHIAKTGGSSIFKLLEKNGLNDGILSNKSLNYDKKVEYFLEIVNEWDQYYKFTFVRNKYDQLISHYNYDIHMVNKISFDNFIKEHVSKKSKFFPLYDYWLDQYFLTTIDNKNIFDFVGQFENYANDVRSVCDQININYEEIRVNVGMYKKSKKESYYNNELKQLVDQKFESEMKYFHWELENSSYLGKLRNDIEGFFSRISKKNIFKI